MLTRLRVALRSPDGLRRLTHFVAGKLLFSLPQGVRRWLFRGEQAFCPLCSSELRGFLRLHRRYHRYCPLCASLQRQRFVWLLFDRQGLLVELAGGKRMLHFAPEPCLEAQFRRIPGLDYLSADLYNPRAMRKMDISRIPCRMTASISSTAAMCWSTWRMTARRWPSCGGCCARAGGR